MLLELQIHVNTTWTSHVTIVIQITQLLQKAIQFKVKTIEANTHISYT